MQKSWLQSLQPRSKGWILSELVCWLPCYAGAVTLNLERKRPVSSCIQFMMFQKVLWFMFASCLWLINLCMQTSCHRATNFLVMDTFANVLVLSKTLFIILDKYIWANFFPLGVLCLLWCFLVYMFTHWGHFGPSEVSFAAILDAGVPETHLLMIFFKCFYVLLTTHQHQYV